jgi:3-oxoacyl-[acyl-carrier-protein] synthase-3
MAPPYDKDNTMQTTIDAYITATGVALPGEPLGNDVVARKFGASTQWIEMFVGTRQRYLAMDLDTGRVTHTLADLGAEAGAQAIAWAGLEPREIDFVVLSTSMPDMLMPATVNLIVEQLGINELPTYQVQSGCAGAVQGLDLTRRLLDDEHRVGLVIGADSCTKHVVLDRDVTEFEPAELVNYVLFGDGAGAAVVTSEKIPDSIAIRSVINRCGGLGRAPGQIVRWFGAADRHSGQQPVEEDYKAIEKEVPQLALDAMYEVLDSTGWTSGSVSYLLPPQLSGRMTQRIVKKLGLDGATEISCVADTGNNGNAMPFLQLDLLRKQMRSGERAVGIAIESSKWIKGAFALEKV